MYTRIPTEHQVRTAIGCFQADLVQLRRRRALGFCNTTLYTMRRRQLLSEIAIGRRIYGRAK